MPDPADKARPGVRVVDDPEVASRNGFAVESFVRPDKRFGLRLWFDGHKTVVDEETAWTIIRLMVQALAAAEGDALVFGAISKLMDEETAARMLEMMRDERGARDVSFTRRHFFERITDKGQRDG